MVPDKKHKPFRSGNLEALCKILADTYTGLTGTEIGDTLAQIGVTDRDPMMTKWIRLHNALSKNQNERQDGNRVLSFIAKALHPIRYINKSKQYELMLRGVNTVLAFHGLNFRDDGKFYSTKPVSTLAEE